MPTDLFDEHMLGHTAEHQRVKDYVHEELKDLDHPEAMKALRKTTALLRLLAGSLWDGSQGLDLQRQEQARIDATVMADFGSAIEEHLKAHRG